MFPTSQEMMEAEQTRCNGLQRLVERLVMLSAKKPGQPQKSLGHALLQGAHYKACSKKRPRRQIVVV
jgi:hypothetical protein